jgi:hypothetical protein
MATITLEIPTYPEPYFQYTTVIEDSNKLITLRWVDRTSSWYIDIKQEDLTPIVEGVRLVPYYPLLTDYALTSAGMTGYFLLIDSGSYLSNKLGENPEALNQYYKLYYIYEEQ